MRKATKTPQSKARRRGPRYAKRKTVKGTALSSTVRPTTPSIEPAGALPGPMKQQGSDGVLGWGGYQLGGETNGNLVGENLMRTYARLLSLTLSVAAAVRYSLNLIRGINWESTPNPRAPSAKLGQDCADLLRDGLIEADMPTPWSEHSAKQALSAWYGYALHEWQWRRRTTGQLVYKDLQHRPQYTIRRWDIRVEGEPWRGVEQHTRQGGFYYIERSRLWYTADKLITDQPTGVGLLRHVVEHARRLERFEELEGYAYDANLRGIPIGRAPIMELDKYARTHVKDKTPKTFVDEMTSELRNFLTNHIKTPEQGMLLDSAVYTSTGSAGDKSVSSVPQWAIDLLQGDDMGLDQIARTIERVNREILRVMGCEWMMMGDAGGGSRAMHTDKTAQYGAFLNGIVSSLATTARNDLGRPLVAANHGNEAAEEACPLIVASPITTESLREATGAVLDMVNGGSFVPPDDPIWNQLRKRGGFAMQMKIPPDIRGALMRVPRDPNDPSNPDNGGDGRPGEDEDEDLEDTDAGETDDKANDTDTEDLRQGGKEAKAPKKRRRRMPAMPPRRKFAA